MRVALLFTIVVLGTAVLAQDRARTVWDGVFTEEQAIRGQQVYKQSCSVCHQDDLQGKYDAPALVGAAFTSRWTGSTADDIVQTIRASMPQDAPNSLGAAGYVDIVAYILKANGSPAGAAELPTDRAALKEIQVTPR